MRARATAAEGDSVLRALCFIETVSDASITAAGGRVYDRQGDIAIVLLPLDSVESLAQSPDVSRIEASAPCRALLDSTRIVTRADLAHTGRALPQAFEGEGVVVGVMDIGFDLTHPTFYDAEGRPRISAFWDMLAPNDTAFPVGRSYRAADIPAIGHATDGLLQTHGTHTLGIAAGGGHTSPYRGLAPKADIAIVANAVGEDLCFIDSLNYYRYTSATDALGFKYLFDYADTAGKPCVASFSEGYRPMLDDDDRLYAEYLARITGPGHIIAASAGNESNKQTYLRKPLGKAAAGTFLFANADSVAFAARINGRGEATLNIKDYTTLRDSTLFRGQTDTILYITLPVRDYLRHQALIATGPQTDIDIWTLSSALMMTASADDPQWADAETSHNINAPAAFPAVIAVGSTVHRNLVYNYRGELTTYTDSIGRLATYSSVGPTLDGRIKPDITAPGNQIISAYSSWYIENNPELHGGASYTELFDWRGRRYLWASDTGTSMACPAAAGTIALWLEADPTLTPEDVKEVLAATATHPDPTLCYPNCRYGYGEIDAYAGLLHILGIDGIVSRRQLTAADIDIKDGVITCRQPFRVYSASGRLVTESRGTLDISSLPSGVYAVQSGGRSILVRR